MSLNLAIVSGKGGTGKSTVSCGLALSLARMNKRVILIDLDAGLRCLDMFFGIEENIVFDLFDSISSGDFENALYYPHGYNKNICVVPAPPKDKTITKEQFFVFYEKCKKLFDAVILDLPAGLDFSILEDIKDLKYICVSNSDPVSVRDASFVAETLSEKNINKPLLIINKFYSELIRNKTYKNIDDIIDLSGIKLLGIIPFSTELMLFPISHKLNKRTNAYKALNRIIRRLGGESVLLPKPQKI
ncbi:MAG: P-loop NTPase [Clostridia bacterium]|nr:P-loop NTPase [Clostridia bacterium]